MQENLFELNINEDLKLENQLCFPLYAASRIIVQAYGPMMAELKITYPQFLILMVLWENDGLNLSQIGAKLYLDSGTLTPLLQKMVKSGLILRKRCKEDQREVKNYLTRKAQELKSRAATLRHDLACATGLTPEDGGRIAAEIKLLLKIMIG
jgi:DNA-binding MarR family transcriptional regulator